MCMRRLQRSHRAASCLCLSWRCASFVHLPLQQDRQTQVWQTVGGVLQDLFSTSTTKNNHSHDSTVSCLWREMAGGMRTQVLPMSSVVPVDEEQRVSAVNLTGPCRAFWDLEFLAVPGEQKAIVLRWLHKDPLATSGTFGSGRTL